MSARVAIVGLGANVGAREAFIRSALQLIDGRGVAEVRACSRLFCTEPVGPPQRDYLNAAVRLRTERTPEALLGALQDIEAELGRRRDGVRWGPRTVDLDILWMDGAAMHTPALTVPHPRLTERSFALAPLLDVAPELGSRYGEALRSAGGEPPALGPLTFRPVWESFGAPADLAVRARGSDDLDAMAAAVAGLVSRLCEGRLPPATEVRARTVPIAGQPAVRALATAAVDALRHRFVPRETVVEARHGRQLNVRLVGSRGPAIPIVQILEAAVRDGVAQVVATR